MIGKLRGGLQLNYEQNLSFYGFISDVELSSTQRILDRLPTTDWLSEDDRHSVDAINVLRGLSDDPRRSLCDANRDCLKRVLEKLPPLPTHEPEPVDPTTDASGDLQSPDEAKTE